MTAGSRGRRTRRITPADLQAIAVALLSVGEKHAKATNYQELEKDALWAYAEEHLLPAIEARKIFLDSEVMEKEGFAGSVCQQYAIIYAGVVAAHHLLENIEKKDASQGGSDQGEAHRAPYLNRMIVTLHGVPLLPEGEAERLRHEAHLWFMNFVEDQGDCYVLRIAPLRGYQAFRYADEGYARLTHLFPHIRIEVTLDHVEYTEAGENSRLLKTPVLAKRATVCFDTGDDEHRFAYYDELLTVLATEQAYRARTQTAPVESIVVRFYESDLAAEPRHICTYTVEGSRLRGIISKSRNIDATLQQLGMPTE